MVAGDFNWRKAYGDSLTAEWEVSEGIRSVKEGAAAPTRCISRELEVSVVSAHDILGIPHHKAVLYSADHPAPRPAQKMRLRRCAKYEWRVKPNSGEEDCLLSAANDVAPKHGYAGPPAAAWDTWHKRAKAVLKAACALELAVPIVKAERDKGTRPTTRLVAASKAGRLPETIALRRTKRLKSAVAAQISLSGRGSALSPSQVRHWRACCRDKVAKAVQKLPRCQGQASDVLDAACAEIASKEAAARTADWKRSFRQWGLGALRAGAKIVKPGSPPPTFSADEMRGDWSEFWTKTTPGQDHASAWKSEALKAGLAQAPAAAWTPPSLDRLHQAILETAGLRGLMAGRSQKSVLCCNSHLGLLRSSMR